MRGLSVANLVGLADATRFAIDLNSDTMAPLSLYSALFSLSTLVVHHFAVSSRNEAGSLQQSWEALQLLTTPAVRYYRVHYENRAAANTKTKRDQ